MTLDWGCCYRELQRFVVACRGPAAACRGPAAVCSVERQKGEREGGLGRRCHRGRWRMRVGLVLGSYSKCGCRSLPQPPGERGEWSEVARGRRSWGETVRIVRRGREWENVRKGWVGVLGVFIIWVRLALRGLG